ncbi:MAG: peptidase S16 [Gammaproteobacteria bacterium]|nr:MAG: peptidase S16 [Gammaproteobacteria bacterium]
MELPLFPVSTVLFPGSTLSLRIFEPRYLELISHCMKTDSGFGVSLIKAGKEVGPAADCYTVGTLIKIIDWGQGKDGFLEIEIEGVCRFKTTTDWVEPNQLKMAEVEMTPEPAHAVPGSYLFLAEFLEGLMRRVEGPSSEQLENYEDAVKLGYKLAEFLPLGSLQKQSFLEMSNPVKRLELLAKLVDQTLSRTEAR